MKDTLSLKPVNVAVCIGKCATDLPKQKGLVCDLETSTICEEAVAQKQCIVDAVVPYPVTHGHTKVSHLIIG